MIVNFHRDLEIYESLIDLSFFREKRVLITGATGLMGAYLSEIFAVMMKSPNGPKELILSSRSGKSPYSSNISGKTVYFTGDLTNSKVVSSLPNSDVVIHAAGYGQPSKFSQDKLRTLDLNVACTLRLVEKTKSGGTFLFLSSSEVYSGSKSRIHSESDIGSSTPQHERAAYIEGKRAGEAIINSAREQAGLRAFSARLALAYGPGTRTDDARVLNSFIRRAIMERKISLLDQGAAVRTYCYVSDAVLQILAILCKGESEVYNVGGTSRVSILELAKLIAVMTDARVELPEGDYGLTAAPKDVALDLSKVQKLIGNFAYTDLEVGLSRTISWQKQFLYE